MSEHDHCDHDPIECTYDALVGEYREAVAERDRLLAVVRKIVSCAGIGLEGKNDEWLSYACEEYAGPHEFTPDEMTAYRAALGDSKEATDG